MSEQPSFNQLIPTNIKELPTSEKILTFNNDIGNMAFAKNGLFYKVQSLGYEISQIIFLKKAPKYHLF